MQDIDFLPSSFHERRARRKARLLQLSALLCALLGVGAAVVGQVLLCKSVEFDLENIQPRYTRARSRHAALCELADRLREAEAAVELDTYLRHPWPRTRLLAEIVRELPPSIAVTELTVAARGRHREATRTGQVQRSPTPSRELSPAHRDLRDLRDEYDGRQFFITISGLTHDAAQLHPFVARLADRPLFLSSKLDSLEVEGSARTARFVALVRVAPGYGQPGGPDMPLADGNQHPMTGSDPQISSRTGRGTSWHAVHGSALP